MKNINKKRIIKDYHKLSQDLKKQIKLEYPNGYDENLIKFKNAADQYISALPYETEDTIYLIKMDIRTARIIVDEDDDFDESGNLKEDIRELYEDEYSEPDF